MCSVWIDIRDHPANLSVSPRATCNYLDHLAAGPAAAEPVLRVDDERPHMSSSELEAAAEALEAGAEAASGGTADRLATQAETVADLAERPSAADHGRLARLEHTLREIRESASDAAAARIDDAMDRISAYRETVEGV